MEPRPATLHPWWTARRIYAAYGVALALLVPYAVKVVVRHNIDFRCYWDVGQYALNHLNIYMPSGVGYYVFYLPYFALLMIPWALLPYLWGGVAWFVLKAGMVALMQRTHQELVAQWALPRRQAAWLTWLPLLLLVNCWNNDFKLGQINVFIHFFLWRAVVDAQRGRTTRAGLWFVLSMVKVTPWVFVPYFVLARQWRLLGAIAAWSVAAALALVVWFGPAEAVALPARWLEVSQREKLGIVGSANIENQSIHGVVARALASVSIDGPRDYTFTSTPADETLFKPITYALCLLVFLLALALVARPAWRWGLRDEDAALMMLVMLLVSPDTRLFHMVHLFFPLQVLARALREQAHSAAASVTRVALALVALTFVAVSRDLIGPALHSVLRYHGHQAVTLVVLTMSLMLWSVRSNQTPGATRVLP